jgi:hypothetical protein
MYFDPYAAALYSSSLTGMSTGNSIRPTPMTESEVAIEREKTAITSYEEGWDRWDGPIWPIGYVQCRMRK